MSRRVCIFSHYDRDSIVRRHVFGYVQAIVSAGFSVMFVSTADRIAAEDRERLEALGADVHVRENKGLDFGSWQYGLKTFADLDGIDQLLLANDSVFGPLFDLGYLFDQMNRTDSDFWGVTDTYEGTWHLQSYFLCFNKSVLRSAAFRDFFKTSFFSLSKHQVIIQGEVALSQNLIRAGFKGAASCPYGALTVDRFDGPYNPTQHYWDELIEKCRCPFLKVQLLRDNPDGVENTHRWRDVLARETDYDITLIEDYLAVFGQVTRKKSMMRLALYYVRWFPYVVNVVVRAAVKAAKHPVHSVMVMEQYIATDTSELPHHPRPRPKFAYGDLEFSDADPAFEAVDPASKRQSTNDRLVSRR